MDAATRAGHGHFLRFVLVAFALPALPAAGVFLSQAAGLPDLVSIGVGILMLVAWGFVARQLLVKHKSPCPECGKSNARIESLDEIAFLVCPDCGWKKETGYDFKDVGG